MTSRRGKASPTDPSPSARRLHVVMQVTFGCVISS